MNLRIKELAKQSDCTIDGMGYGEGNIEGLAKLIIQECIWQLGCSKQVDPYTGAPYDNQVNAVLSKQIENIKEHFGIE